MSKICVYETKSLTDLLDDLPILKEQWAKHGVIVVSGLNPTEEHILPFLKVFGPAVGVRWVNTPNHNIDVVQPGHWFYEEGHGIALDVFGKVDKDRVLVPWHLENLHYLRPQVAGAWVMRQFDCAADSGATGFIDMSSVWESLATSNPDLADFAARSRFTVIPTIEGSEESWNHAVSQGEHPFYIDDQPHYSKPAVDALSETSKKVLRVGFHDQYLFSVDGKPPTGDDHKLAEQLLAFVVDTCMREPTNVTSWWHWTQGDFMLVDLFKMQHAVRGGFDRGDRILHGYWAF